MVEERIGCAEDEDVMVVARCREIHFSEKKGQLQKIEEAARKGLALLTGGVPKATPRTLNGKEQAHAGTASVSQLVTVGQIWLPASFYK